LARDFLPAARFTVVSGASPGAIHEAQGAVVRIGALPSNDISLGGADADHVAPVHAKILFSNTRFRLYDNEDEFGTYVNGERIEQSVLKSGDEVRFGEAGLVLMFEAVGRAAELEGTPASGESGRLTPPEDATVLGEGLLRGSVVNRKARGHPLDKDTVTIGRAGTNDIVIDHAQVSGFHARLVREGEGWVLEDNNSLNGTFVGAERVTRHTLSDGTPVHIGPFLLACADDALFVYDEREETEIDVVDVSRVVNGDLKLLDGISLRIPPGELVGLLGPSGAGKTTLLRALNGLRPATTGNVFINGVDLYDNFEHLKQSIGYVPQDDIIHVELTAERTLRYVSLLRLPRDTSPQERAARIAKVMELLELTERKDVPIWRLSGGQRKRVSLGVELMTEPNLIFLDEPTAGLDPALESKMMVLFKELAQQGRTVVVTTHLMENVELFDKLVVLVRGRLAFYGTPQEALIHFRIKHLRTIFGKIARRTPDEWAQAYQDTELHDRYVRPVRDEAATEERERTGQVHARMLRRTHRSQGGGARQLGILCRRYLEILLRDRRNTALLLLQAPIIACFVALALEHTSLILFLLSLSAIWFGVNNAAKEIVKELPVYRRERMVNLGLMPYVLSKILVLSGLATFQCLLLLLVVTAFRHVPGSHLAIFMALVLTSVASLLMGLTISALVDSTDKANAIVPLVLIPQVLFAGVFTPLEGPTGYVSAIAPSRWSYDLLKEVVLATHDDPEQPLVSYAHKDKVQEQLVRLDTESQRLVNDIDRLASKVPESRDRVQRTWERMRAEIEALRAQRTAFQESYQRVSTQIETDYRAIEQRLSTQRLVADQLEEDFNWLRNLVAEVSVGGEPDLAELMRRLDPDWLAQRQAQMEQVIASYQQLNEVVDRMGRSREPLEKERDEAEVRAREIAGAEQVLLQGQQTIVDEVESMQRVARKLTEHQEQLKANATEVRRLQAGLSDDLRERRFVYMGPNDSVARAASILGVFCGVFLALTLVLQRRRDRED
jgi:ABC-type multidrug transport system ATPase subunit/pSer/pThr/pTyr-binding forkhead associated (FHA) protein